MMLRIAIVCALGVGCAQDKSSDSALEQQSADEHAAAKQATPADHPGHFAHRFENANDWTASFDDPARDGWQKPARVVELLDIRRGMAVADIGAGTGYFLQPFSRAVGDSGSVVGLDIEPDMVRYMTERVNKAGLSNTSARLVRADDPQLPASSIDRIVVVNTWHHIADRTTYAHKLAAALRPSGSIAIIDYTKESPRGPPPQHRLTAAQVVAELRAAGLVASEREEDLPFQYLVVGRLAPKNGVAKQSSQAVAKGPSAAPTPRLTPKQVPFRNARLFEGMLVGGQPTLDQLRAAAAAGVKTVINLQTVAEPGVADEAKLAGELGIDYVSIPVAGAAGVTVPTARKLDEAIANAKGPIVVHCRSGDRAGAVLAVRAHAIQHKTADAALRIGQRTGMTSLEPVVRKLVGAGR